MDDHASERGRKGRGATMNPEGRFAKCERTRDDDGWGSLEEPLPPLETIVQPEAARSIVSRNDSPDLPFSQSINPYRGCEHGCIYCLEGDTPILYADGSHRPIKDAEVGDAILGTARDGAYRRYVETRILRHWKTVKPAYRIVLADGTELTASADHRFLTDRGWKFVGDGACAGSRRPHLTLNDRLLGTGAFAEPPEPCPDYRCGYLCGLSRGDGHVGSYAYAWPRPSRDEHAVLRLATIDAQALERAREYLRSFRLDAQEPEFRRAVGDSHAVRMAATHPRHEAAAQRRLALWPAVFTDAWYRGFLAGMFDAERHHEGKGVIRISNTDSSIVRHVTRALERFGFGYRSERVEREGRKALTIIRLTGGLPQQLRFFQLTDPAIARKRSISGLRLDAAVNLRVTAIERLDEAARMYDITTGTGDFVANGVVSHNCYARPSHAYVDLSPGLDFETRLFYKRDAAARLAETFRKPGYRVSPIMLGANTDAYQPIEREYRATRSILEVMRDFRHPLTIVTKSTLVLRDLDLLAELAADDLVQVMVSVTSLDSEIKRTLEPRAAGPRARLRAVRELARAGVPAGVMVAPIIPAITDHEIERIVEAAAEAGAECAGYVMLRLPHEVKMLFRAWLDAHYPERAEHVMSLIRAMRGGRDNDPRFGSRMRGEGAYAALVARRFHVACRRRGLLRAGARRLRTSLFAAPAEAADQLKLFR